MNRVRALAQLRQLKKLGGAVRLAAEEWRHPHRTLIAIIMSARTRDEVTIVVAEKLFKKYPDIRALAHAKESDVAAIIRPVNFYRNKTRSVVACAKQIEERYGTEIPERITIEELIELPGVGRKTANVFLAERGEAAIGVDTHVAHISRTLRWTRHHAPEKIERDLEKLFPRSKWRLVNSICVQFGKKYTSRKEKASLLSRIAAHS